MLQGILKENRPKEIKIFVKTIIEIVPPVLLPAFSGVVTYLNNDEYSLPDQINSYNNVIFFMWENGDKIAFLNHKEAAYKLGDAEGIGLITDLP